MKRFTKSLLCFLIVFVLLLSMFSIVGFAEDNDEIKILFTHDIHDYFYPTTTIEHGVTIEHGGAAKLATVINENKSDNSIYLDAGDFSMGTLFQAAYSTDAFELRNLGVCGCKVTTFGNHEFDYGLDGISKMLRAAKASGDPLPEIVQSNIDFSGELTEEQKEFKAACEEYGVKENTIVNIGGKKVGIFGVVGYDCISCIQAELNYIDYIEASKIQVQKLLEQGCDLIICLSHSGTDETGESGEDFDLAGSVPGIDVIISGHSHSTYFQPVTRNETVLVSSGEYLKNVGQLELKKSGDKVTYTGYNLLPINSSIANDPVMTARIEEQKKHISDVYLEGKESFDQIIAHSKYNFTGLNEMYATHQEYPLGDMIADSYLYEAKKNGIDDIDVAIVGLGTVRGSVKVGNITVADAFEVCSLGAGEDGSAGHPLLAAFITGKELKLITELDASLGSSVDAIKMSYSGLSYTFNARRIILDKVIKVNLVDENGNEIKIDDNKLYKCAINMYAANMLGMLNGLTKGVLSITPKDPDGNPVDDFYSLSLVDKNGDEIKEWVAFKDYLESFPVGKSGYPEVPEDYANIQGRKIKVYEGGIAQFYPIGVATRVIPIAIVIFLLLLVLIIVIIILVIKSVKKKKKKDKEE